MKAKYKILCTVMTVAIALAVMPQLTATAALHTIGDINGDGSVDNLDAVIVLKYDAGMIQLEREHMYAADVNADEEVNNLDAALILKHDAGMLDIKDYIQDEDNVASKCKCNEPAIITSCEYGIYCDRCNMILQPAEGHNIVNGACTKCDYSTITATQYDNIIKFILSTGENSATQYKVTKKIANNTSVVLSYDDSNPQVGLILGWVETNGDNKKAAVICYKPDSSEIYTRLTIQTETDTYIASGYFDMTTVNWNAPELDYSTELHEVHGEQQYDALLKFFPAMDAYLTTQGFGGLEGLGFNK